MEAIILAAGRTPRQRNTLYADPPDERRKRSFAVAGRPPWDEATLAVAPGA
jgi:hypothetical protein